MLVCVGVCVCERVCVCMEGGRECDVRIINYIKVAPTFLLLFLNSTSIYRLGGIEGGVARLFDTRYAAQPRLVECRAHIHARQIRRRTLDAMRYSASQLIAPIGTLQHQGATAVTLETE